MTTPARRPHPDSRWFAAATLGIGFDWSIDPGADSGAPATNPAQRLDLARRFDPAGYDPHPWLALAVQAGCRYAVLTARDAQGYAFWPSDHAALGTRLGLGGRDLIEPFYDACRRTGLKAGLRFTLTGDADDARLLQELITRSSRPDLLILDGQPAPELVEALRQHRPGMPIGTGAPASGDFQIVDPGQAVQCPEGWWARPHRMDLAAGPAGTEAPGLPALLVALAETRARGGNFLLQAAPGVDGRLPEGYTTLMGALRRWMGHSHEAITGTRAGPWPDQSDVPVTTRGDTWYFHFTSPQLASAQVDAVGRPTKTRLLRTGTPVPFDYLDGSLTLTPAAGQRTALVDVVAATGLTLARR